ncbi:MAG TPA: protein phosphatase 2C domain-containing protein [Kofleriaceae bacterium]|nr:protein phosphatase 2C domain-containing protein [Kofleriaceae bacterium]
MRTISVGLTDVGRRRTINEDAFHRDDDLGFYVVADGVGGHSKGEVASAEAVEQMVMWVARARAELLRLTEAAAAEPDARWDVRRLLENGVQSACYMVFGMAELDPEKRGMSTTMSAVLVRGGFCYAAHVGDSRVYRVRGAEVLQLTEDHTLINYKLKNGLISRAEAATASGRNVITRAVGHKDYVQVDTADLDVQPGDRFLLCTDGLHGYLDGDGEVAALIGDGTLESGAQAAIALANQRGGKDNITAVVVEVEGQGQG